MGETSELGGTSIFLKLLKSFGVSEVKKRWFWVSWTRPLCPTNMKMMSFPFFGESEASTLLVPNEAE